MSNAGTNATLPLVGALSNKQETIAASAEAKVIAEAASLEHRQKILGTSGGYRVLQELGKGGNSCVYLVEAISGPFRGVLFALKIFLRISDEVRLQRFNTEIQFLQKCNHPSILRVFDQGLHYVQIAGAPRTLPFVVAEYLPKTLRSAMLSGLTILEKTAYTLQLLAGLVYLASRDPLIIHRDIKPENVFVKGKSAVLGDFGLLKAGDGIDPSIEFHIQASTGIRFPRMYPTPDLIEYCKEREHPLPLSPKSDVFQLGLVIAELFTSDIPLKPRSVPFSAIELADVGRVAGAQGDAIQAIIRRMLELDTERRPNAADLFDPWEGIFLKLVDMAQQLEGRVFNDS
ncbi:MAG: protein kinase [Steroidobacteraceae bacterium]